MKNLIKKILKESDDLSWIHDVSDTVPSITQRTRINFKDFILDYMVDNLDLIDYLYSENFIKETQQYLATYTDQQWDEYGLDQWRNGDWKNNFIWFDEPDISYYELKELLELGCNKWAFIENQTEDYNLENGTYDDRMIFKRKSDNRYFALNYRGDVHDGTYGNDNYLYEIFEKLVKIFV